MLKRKKTITYITVKTYTVFRSKKIIIIIQSCLVNEDKFSITIFRHLGTLTVQERDERDGTSQFEINFSLHENVKH